MASSGYTAITFVADELLTSTKMNLMAANDASFNTGNGFNDGILATRHFGAASVPSTALPAGAIVQVVQTDFSAVAAAASIIPYDNTIPQIGEGFEVMTRAITPKFSTSDLIIEAVIYGSINGAGASEFIAALFRDATANAIAGDSVTISGAGYLETLVLTAKVAAGSTSATTFRVRLGSTDGRNVSFNGYASGTGGVGTQVFGAAAKSSLRVTEVKT